MGESCQDGFISGFFVLLRSTAMQNTCRSLISLSPLENLHDELYNIQSAQLCYTTARKRILRFVGLQCLVAKCCKDEKRSLQILYILFCIARGKSYHFRGNFSSEMVTFSPHKS